MYYVYFALLCVTLHPRIEYQIVTLPGFTRSSNYAHSESADTSDTEFLIVAFVFRSMYNVN